MKPLLKLFAVIYLLSFSVLSIAQTDFVEGQHYFRLGEPVRIDKPNKIEVVEIFQYTCPACFRFEPMTATWSKEQNDDVNFVRLHAQFNAQSSILSRAMFTAKALRKTDEVHPALFQAFHLNGNQLTNKNSIKKVFTANGVDEDRFEKTWESFGVNSLVKRGTEKVRALKITSTPQIAVDGTYIIQINNDVRDQESMLQVADFLVGKLRAERGL